MKRLIISLVLITTSIHALSYNRFTSSIGFSIDNSDHLISYVDPITQKEVSSMSLGGGLTSKISYEHFLNRIVSIRGGLGVKLNSLNQDYESYFGSTIFTEVVPYFNYNDYVQAGFGLSLDNAHSINYSVEGYTGSIEYAAFSPSLGLVADLRLFTKQTLNNRTYYFAGVSGYLRNYKLKRFLEVDTSSLVEISDEDLKFNGSVIQFYLGATF